MTDDHFQARLNLAATNCITAQNAALAACRAWSQALANGVEIAEIAALEVAYTTAQQDANARYTQYMDILQTYTDPDFSDL